MLSSEQPLTVQVIRLADDAKLPSRAHEHDAGLDLYAHRVDSYDGVSHVCYSGVAVAIPVGYVGLLVPRSSVTKYGVRLANSIGVIDAGYRGEVIAKFDCTTIDSSRYYKAGDRFAQLVIVPIPTVTITEVEQLPRTSRDVGGFGSSGE